MSRPHYYWTNRADEVWYAPAIIAPSKELKRKIGFCKAHPPCHVEHGEFSLMMTSPTWARDSWYDGHGGRIG